MWSQGSGPHLPGPCGHRAATPISRGCQPRCSGSRAAVCMSGEDCGRGPWGGRRAPEGSEAQAIWNVRSHLGAARIHCNAPGPATPAALQTPPFSTWPNFPSWAPWLRGWEDQFSVPLLITLCI